MPKRRTFNIDALDDLIRRTNGVVRYSELRTLGVSASAISYRVRARGVWQALLPGIIVTSNGAVTWQQRLLGAVRYAGSGALITGLSALRLYGVSGLPDSSHQVHVLVPHRRRRASRAYVAIERTRRMPRHRTIRDIPCAAIVRATLDAARRVSDIDAARAIIAAVVQQGWCTVDGLVAELAAGSRRGSRLPRQALREVIAGVRSVAEAKVRRLIRAARLPEPRWNHDIFDASGRWLGRPDAVWPELGVVVEVDSIAWHLSPAAYRKTQARQRRMTKAGLVVVPVSPSDIRDNPEAFIAELRQTLAMATDRAAPAIRATAA